MGLSDIFAAILGIFKRAPAPTAVQPPPVSPSSTPTAAPVRTDWIALCQPLTEASESCALVAYPDPASGGDPWTCGYGATGPDVKPGTVWTPQQAADRLDADLVRFGGIVDALVTVALTAEQKAALVDFTFNVGQGNLASSTLLKLLNAGEYAEAADQFVIWNQADGKVMPGLVTRRARERSLYLTRVWQ
jgi:lysozyme